MAILLNLVKKTEVKITSRASIQYDIVLDGGKLKRVETFDNIMSVA